MWKSVRAACWQGGMLWRQAPCQRMCPGLEGRSILYLRSGKCSLRHGSEGSHASAGQHAETLCVLWQCKGEKPVPDLPATGRLPTGRMGTGAHLLKAARPLSDCRGPNTSCRKVMPTLYMSKRSGLFMRHRMGDSSAATGRGGAL